MSTVFFLEGFGFRFDLMVVAVADATDLREMRGRMGRLGISLTFVCASAISAQTMQTEWRVGVGVEMEEAMV